MKTSSTLLFLLAAALPLLAADKRPAPAPPQAVVDSTAKAKRASATADLKAIAAALLAYRDLAGQLPTVAQGLDALIAKPTKEPIPERWAQCMEKYPVDPWGFPYGYAVRQKDGKDQQILISKGPDRESGKDDIERIVAPEPAKKK
ncbi:type II secretion system protein GspG [Luteolibacter sp. Populi]|uniref:type II secretion system protein GspG n=1 Tax=Luteolibacter sp. Populi TaxID=3230487 RepID=UPI0034673572